MTRTSYYVSLYGDTTCINPSSVMYNDELFGSISPKDKKQIVNITHRKIINWLQSCSDKIPNLTNGINNSIVDWFLQSAHLLPKILNISQKPSNSNKVSDIFDENDSNLNKSQILPNDVANSIKILIKNNCITKETQSLLKAYINFIPPADIVWRILEDLHNYSLQKTEVTVPLTRTIGSERPIVFQKKIINKFLSKLRLPLLNDDPDKSFLDDPFKNGKLLMNLYSSLTGEKINVKISMDIQQAQSNVEKALNLLIKSSFIDESFSKCSANIVNGDMFLIQRIISLIMFNATEIKSPHSTPQKSQNLISLVKSEENFEKMPKTSEKVFVKESKVSDGISLMKLLTCIDSDFSGVECLFAKPENEIEKKWNIRKSLEFLYKKSNWPKECKIDSSLLYSGEYKATNSFYNGMISCYKNKFSSLAAVINLKGMLGLDTTKI